MADGEAVRRCCEGHGEACKTGPRGDKKGYSIRSSLHAKGGKKGNRHTWVIIDDPFTEEELMAEKPVPSDAMAAFYFSVLVIECLIAYMWIGWSGVGVVATVKVIELATNIVKDHQ